MEIDEYKKIALNPDSWFEYARKQKKLQIQLHITLTLDAVIRLSGHCYEPLGQI